jgi:hypothetical protein
MKYFLILAAWIGATAAAAAPDPDAGYLREPLPALTALAAERNIPVSGFDAPRSERTIRKGDSLVVLFSLVEKGLEYQWILQASAARNTGARDEHAVLDLTLTGPFCADLAGKPIARNVKEMKASITVKTALLSYGMGDWCEEMRALSKYGREQEKEGLTDQEKAKLTAQVRRMWPVIFVAMPEFLTIAIRTDGVKAIIAKAIDLPSVFALLTHLKPKMDIQIPNISTDAAGSLTFADGTTEAFFRVPFSIAMLGQPCSNATLLAVQARPPFLMSAGVTELDLASPSRPGNRLAIRVLSARLSPQ